MVVYTIFIPVVFMDIEYKESLKLRLLDHSEDFGDCRNWIGKSVGYFGYGFLAVKGKRRAAHRASWMAWKGEIPKGKWVLHKCDNPKCIKPDHLFLGDAKENAHDMINKNRNYIPRGERQWQAKLTEIQVIEIRDLYSKGISVKEICKLYNITKGAINPLLRRITWKHVK